jgi:hypothetical protein
MRIGHHLPRENDGWGLGARRARSLASIYYNCHKVAYPRALLRNCCRVPRGFCEALPKAAVRHHAGIGENRRAAQ